MLVSARSDAGLRRAVTEGQRPCPEYLRLEQRHGVTLLDLSSVSRGGRPRTILRSLLHVAAARRRLSEVDVVLSDGEHLGIPLALSMQSRPMPAAHVVIGHHLTTPAKAAAFRMLKADRRMTRILVHSPSHRDAAIRRLGLAPALVRLVPYGVDLDFWHPIGLAAEDMVLSPGREHRDLATLAAVAGTRTERVVVTGYSPHSARAHHTEPLTWPANVTRSAVDFLELRRLYARAAVVVVPLLQSDFPAGVTTVIEAMAMGRPVIASATRGLSGIIDNGRTGLLVTPGDAGALGAALDDLIADPDRRARIGAAARVEAESRFGLDVYADRLAEELRQAAMTAGPGG